MRFPAAMALTSATLLACLGLASCSTLEVEDVKARPVALADFAGASGGAMQEPRDYFGMLPTVDPTLENVSEREVPEIPAPALAKGSKSTPAAAQPAGTTVEDPASSDRQRWLIDGLVGQINGRPVFADEFLEPIEASLQKLSALTDRAAARKEIENLVAARFEDWVNSELIISEAESQLSPEQQEGLFAWLRTIQESEVAERGGNVAEARKSLEDDLGMSIDQFLQQRRDAALAKYLIDRKVTPRTIVSWRDIEREYRRRVEEFNPPPRASIGRIAINVKDDALKVEKVKAMAAEGKPFVDIADALKLPKGGVLTEIVLEPGQSVDAAIQADKSLNDAIKAQLRGIPVGVLSAPVEARGFVVWLAVVGVKETAARNLFDTDVQLQLKAELTARRSAIERSRYLTKLRTRWVSDDIGQIYERLLQIVYNRYWKQ